MRRAFTLIEVLVVIAIIALLIAILLPALGGARKSSKQLKALANARSVGQSFGQYLNDYDHLVEARAGIGRYFDFYNDRRPHTALGYQAPASFYDGLLREAA